MPWSDLIPRSYRLRLQPVSRWPSEASTSVILPNCRSRQEYSNSTVATVGPAARTRAQYALNPSGK
jgi:hypothetical protein